MSFAPRQSLKHAARERGDGPLAGRVREPLHVGRADDGAEREADGIADAIVAGARAPIAVGTTGATGVQRDEAGKPKTEEERYKQAAKKLGEAFLETVPGKEIKEKAEAYGEAFVSTLPGKIITGGAVTGAVAALAATHKELPIGIPEVPLDGVRKGLKLKIVYEGPVDAPTKVTVGFSLPLGVPAETRKPKTSESERFRAETARMALAERRFREGLKTPEERGSEERMMSAWLASRMTLPGFKVTGEQPQAEAPKKKREEETGLRRKARGDGAPGSAPPIVHEVVRGSGQPLDPATRRFMEARFGYDFNHVRVHRDAQAGRSAESVDASAYTLGRHIVLAPGQYAPHSAAGRRLLAHELAHVLQQTDVRAAAPALQRKKTPKKVEKPAKFYQYVIDAIEAANRKMAEEAKASPLLVIEHLNYRGLKALLPLCEAVEAERAADVPKLLDTFIEKDIGFHLGTISKDLMIELAARMVKMGLQAESDKLREYYSKQSRWLLGDKTYDPGAAQRNLDFAARLTDLALSSADATTPAKTAASLEFMVRAFVPMRDALSAIDREALEWERRSGSGRYTLRPAIPLVEYWDGLVAEIERLFGGIEAMLQALIDAAAAELEAGKGPATLELARRMLETRLKPALFPEDPKRDVSGLRLRVTRTTLKKGRGKITDPFARAKVARERSIGITTYDPEAEYTRELEMSLERLWKVRFEQTVALAQIYGAKHLIPTKLDKQGALAADAERNAAAIKKMKGGRLRLHSDDDWRAFVLAKYEEMVPEGAPANAEALRSIMDLLFAYMRAFTVHVRHTNIVDNPPDSYLNRDFPRALSGQLVHDCGVYALRVAYILSLVREKLKLRFRFVVLPVHLALVIEGEGLPAFIVHNDHYEELSADDWARVREQFESFVETKKLSDETGMVTVEVTGKPAGPRDETQFIGEIAAATFIFGPLDMPFKVVDVPAAGGDPKKAQRKLWEFYKTTAKTELFGPAAEKKGDPGYLIETRYLGITERMREMHNEVLLKLWNEDAPAAWNKLDAKLSGGGKRATIRGSELKILLEAHRVRFAAAAKPANARLESVQAEERSLGARVREDPRLRRKGIRLSYGPRAATFWGYAWTWYQRRLDALIVETGNAPEAEMKVEDVRKRLAPPFIPTDEKRLAPLD